MPDLENSISDAQTFSIFLSRLSNYEGYSNWRKNWFKSI